MPNHHIGPHSTTSRELGSAGTYQGVTIWDGQTPSLSKRLVTAQGGPVEVFILASSVVHLSVKVKELLKSVPVCQS